MGEKRTLIGPERLVEAILVRIPVLDDAEWLDHMRCEWPEPLCNAYHYVEFFAGRFLDFYYDRPAVAASMAMGLGELCAECDADAKECLGICFAEQVMICQKAVHRSDPDYEQRTDEIEQMLPPPIRVWFTRWRAGNHYTINEYLMDENGNGNGMAGAEASQPVWPPTHAGTSSIGDLR